MTSLDFSYGALVALPLISLTNLDLKIRMPPCLIGSYCSKLNTSLPIRLSISCLSDASNGAPGVVILPCFRSSGSSSSSFGRLMYYYHRMHPDRLFFCIDRLVSIVVGRFYAFDSFFFLRCFGER